VLARHLMKRETVAEAVLSQSPASRWQIGKFRQANHCAQIDFNASVWCQYTDLYGG
jgi:hypothetical protein